jgi:sialate O-acetylesterase
MSRSLHPRVALRPIAVLAGAPPRMRTRGAACLLLALLAPLLAAPARADEAPLLAAPFGDHAVLQRDRPIPLWGRAAPGARVELAFAGHATRVRADAEGRWQAQLPALAAGGPYTLSARSGARRQQLDDVLVGDVWLCSGQSNMELPVERTLDARSELADAAHPRIRLLQVAKHASPVPRRDFDDAPAWQPADADSVRGFSAACYYFGRELQQRVDVPIGLINASWGGSGIQGWIGPAGLHRLSGYDEALAALAAYPHDRAGALRQWAVLWQRWWQQHPGRATDDTPWQPDAGGDWTPATPSARWVAPDLADHVGPVWYRTTLTLDAAQAAQPATLELGRVDEVDMSWLNGQPIGSSDGADTPRRYPLPAGTLYAGRNTLVVNVLNTYRSGGIAGPGSERTLRLADGTRLALDAGGWQTRTVPADDGFPPPAPWMSAPGMSTLDNGLVAPLSGYGLRGALWYQGESNVFEGRRYRQLLAAYRTHLRERFGAGLPLLVVQLANFGPAPAAPQDSDWAQLRESQRLAVADDAASGLAVAIDLGERGDIHPANKQELGRRLARAARHVVYHEALAPSGPVATAARHDGDAVTVAFADVEQGLLAYGGTGPVGFELCGDTQASCRYADARIDGATVRLHADGAAQATRVRYGWADSPIVTLYDGNGLPAGPFELPIH